MRRLALVLALALAVPAGAAAQRPPDVATSQYQFSVTAAAAAWTDVAVGDMTAIGPNDLGGTLVYLSCYNADASAAVRVLLRAEDGEAATAGAYIPPKGSLALITGYSNVSAVSFHGAGGTATVYCLAGAAR